MCQQRARPKSNNSSNQGQQSCFGEEDDATATLPAPKAFITRLPRAAQRSS